MPLVSHNLTTLCSQEHPLEASGPLRLGSLSLPSHILHDPVQRPFSQMPVPPPGLTMGSSLCDPIVHASQPLARSAMFIISWAVCLPS